VTVAEVFVVAVSSFTL